MLSSNVLFSPYRPLNFVFLLFMRTLAHAENKTEKEMFPSVLLLVCLGKQTVKS